MMVMPVPLTPMGRALAGFAGLLLVGCTSVAPAPEVPASPAKPSSTGSTRYDVTFDPAGALKVSIEAPAGVLAELTIERGAEDYVTSLEVAPTGGNVRVIVSAVEIHVCAVVMTSSPGRRPRARMAM